MDKETVKTIIKNIMDNWFGEWTFSCKTIKIVLESNKKIMKIVLDHKYYINDIDNNTININNNYYIDCSKIISIIP